MDGYSWPWPQHPWDCVGDTRLSLFRSVLYSSDNNSVQESCNSIFNVTDVSCDMVTDVKCQTLCVIQLFY